MTIHPSQLVSLLFAMAVCVPRGDAAGQELAPVRFVSPADAKPFGRIDATVRGPNTFKLFPMTPKDKSPLTATVQPILYWYMSAETERPATFSLRRQNGTNNPPLLFRCEIKGPIAAGVHEIRLSEYKLLLNSNTDYSWYVSLSDPAGRQSATITSYIQVPDVSRIRALNEELTATSMTEQYRIYVGKGFWYDALTTIFGLMESAPLSTGYRNGYIDLLHNGGLDDVATHTLILPRRPSTCARASG